MKNRTNAHFALEVFLTSLPSRFVPDVHDTSVQSRYSIQRAVANADVNESRQHFT